MTPLTTEQREYKEKTLQHLHLNLPLLESKLQQEGRRDIANSLQKQVDDIRAHIELLEYELAGNTAGEPVADALYQRIAEALTKKKFYLAKKLIAKLETIEPFYPGLEPLRQEAESGRASRRTRAVAERGSPASQTTSPPLTAEQAYTPTPRTETYNYQPSEPEEEKKGLAQFFQFHIIISCLVFSLILCVMAGVGGIMLLEWLIQGA